VRFLVDFAFHPKQKILRAVDFAQKDVEEDHVVNVVHEDVLQLQSFHDN
jgi:hypothetical protein